VITKEKIVKTFIEDEMKSSYLTYAMSVIVSRALPDVRDGLKPVHRRILYGMNELGLSSDKPFKKAARVVGDVLGKYHPHGDQAVYDALVRMAQPFSMRYPIVDGQGNFGSVDGDAPAAMRYTEVRMFPLAEALLADIDKGTVDFVPNFDDSLKEPAVLPASFPNLLVNGSSGIAVGMATNIPPHNLVETIHAVVKVIEEPDVSIDKLFEVLPGPDFPTGGIIVGRSGITNAYKTGNGQIKLRARASIESAKSGKECIVVNEIPYQVNKSRLIQEIALLAKEKKVDGITDIRDESDKDGLRVVIEVKRGINTHIIMNQLFKMSALEITYGINLLALDNMKPLVMNIKQIVQAYINHREEIVRRRTKFDLEKSEARAHILEGFIKALDKIDQIITLIRSSKTPKEAEERLMEKFSFTKPQAEAILEMRLVRLTGLEREKIKKEHEDLMKLIRELKEILKSRKNILAQIVKELKEISKKFGDSRRTTIIEDEQEVDLKDLIIEEDVVVTITHNGFIKRTPITAFKNQARGGVGVTASTMKEDDFIEHMFVASTHDTMLFISDRGRAYTVPVHEIVNMGKYSKGESIKLFLSLGEDETIAAYVTLKDSDWDGFLLMLTRKGFIKKVALSEFRNVRKTGIIAISLNDDDSLMNSIVTGGKEQVIIATANGYALRLKEGTVRPMGRSARGVTAIRLKGDDTICGITKVIEGTDLLVVTEHGFGKRVKCENFSVHGRGTGGQIYVKKNEKTGKSVGILSLAKRDEFVVITGKGMIIKMKAQAVPIVGKSAAGVKVVNVREDDSLAGVARIVQD
jgi:DNA gyrase subunit A